MTERAIPSANPETSEAGRRFEPREALNFLWRHWKFILAVLTATLAIGVVYLSQQTPLYKATSKVLLAERREVAPTGGALLGDLTLDIAHVESQMAILRSTVFLRRVVRREHLVPQGAGRDPLPSSHEKKRPFLSPILESVLPFLGLAPSQAAAPAAVAVGEEKILPSELVAVEGLKAALSVSRIPQEPYVLAISVTSPNPARAARLANAIASAYLVDKLDTRYEAAKRASAWLSNRLVDLRRQLRQSEDAVATFRAKHDLPAGGRLTLNKQELSTLNARLVDAKADLAQKKARLRLLASIGGKGGALQAMPDIASAGTLGSLLKEASILSAREANLSSRYGPEYPLLINIKAQLRDVHHSIDEATQNLAARIRNDHELARSRVASLEAALQQATGRTDFDEKTAIRLRELERTAAVNKTLFQDFLNRAKITEAQTSFRPQDARIITPALPPSVPNYPRKARFLAVDLFFGLFLGICGAVARDRLNLGFTTPKEIEDELGLPLLSSMSTLSSHDLLVGGSPVPIYDQPLARPLCRFSEAIRSLRSGIQMTDVDHPPKVIQVTSAAPNEGKTTIALSLAASAAAAKLQVLLIDADLRHPSATRILGLGKAAGLVDLLLAEAREEDAIRFAEDKGYFVLPCGNRTQNPTDLLSSERMRSLLASFAAAYDLVVVDTPPAGPVIDPVILSHLCDKVVLVVRWGATAREIVKDCTERLSGHPKIAGIAFNHVDERRAQKYGRYGTSYYYARRYYKNYYQ
jgi:polysaccharide biosynthesis transport protein